MTFKKSLDLSSAALHILAMALMLCDHLWATVLSDYQWLTWLGRLAFPIFAFLLVEGYFHTGNLRRYVTRLVIFALISEIPFNLMTGGSFFYPYHQSIMLTLLMGLGVVHVNETARRSGKPLRRILTAALSILVGYLLGFLTMTDYFGAGVLTPLVFYFFRGKKWWCLVGQIASLYYLNVEVLSGLYFDVALFGLEFKLVQQGLALLALIPIWLYRGRQGHHSKVFQYACYAFYPAHILLLYLIGICL